MLVEPQIPVARPALPSAIAIEPYLRQIDANAWYSNHGPLARTFQARLALHWGVAEPCVSLVSSATSGLTLALQAAGAKPGSRCLMPAWTFAASAAAVSAAGLTPSFVDVCPGTWAPDPAIIERLAKQKDIGAILIVSPFGAPLDLSVWDGVRERTGRPLVIDAAAAFDTLRQGGAMPIGKCPCVVSLHATKVFGIGEGGAVVAQDADFISRIRALSQFGFAGTRESRWPGGNAKLSEYGAAVGLASLDEWPTTRARWQAVTDAYRRLLPKRIGLPPQFGAGWVSSTLTLLWPEDRPDLENRLAASGVATLRWWGLGCHKHEAYGACPREALPVTTIYATRAVGVPFWQALSAEQVAAVCATLDREMPHLETFSAVLNPALEVV